MAQNETPKYLQELEEILREHCQGNEPSLWSKMTEELIEITRGVEAPTGVIGLFIEQTLKKVTDRKNHPMVTAYLGFRLGVAYERYQNANREVK